MENAADALQMAAFVLIFVLALSISINAFGEARQTSQIILDYKDREYDYTYVEDNGETTERIVSAEENYKIVFKDEKGNGLELYKKAEATTIQDKKSICSIDLEKDIVGDDRQKEKFIRAWLMR